MASHSAGQGWGREGQLQLLWLCFLGAGNFSLGLVLPLMSSSLFPYLSISVSSTFSVCVPAEARGQLRVLLPRHHLSFKKAYCILFSL